MVPETFADGIGNISLRNGLLRIELVSMSEAPEPSEGGEPPRGEVRQRVIMSPQAFLQTFGLMQDMMNRLVEAGVVRREGATSRQADQSEG